MVKKDAQVRNLSKISQGFIHKGTIKKSKHLLITGLCNNNCIFCFSEDLLNKRHKSLSKIKREMKEGLREGCEKMVLSGGEPTIHPSFFDIIRLAKKTGYKRVQVITNGRMFSYLDFLNEAIDNGLDEISFSIHSNNQEISDYLSDSQGSFEQSIKGLRNALKKGVWVQVKIVLNKYNVKEIGGILDYFLNQGVKNFEVINLVPEGNAWKNKDRLFFDISNYEQKLCEVFRNAKKKRIVINLSRFDSPLFTRMVGEEEQLNKKFNELSIKEKDYLDAFKTKKILSCFGEKCSYCFIKRECMRVQNSILNRNYGKRLSESGLNQLFRKAIKESNLEKRAFDQGLL